MPRFNLFDATGLEPEELSDVFQANPRAYMAVRGAVSELHLAKVVEALKAQAVIDSYRTASGDMDKDFYLRIGEVELCLECKNVEVIKMGNRSSKIDYLKFLIEKGYMSAESVSRIMADLRCSSSDFQMCTAAELTGIFKKLPQQYRESGMAKYDYSSSRLGQAKVGILDDDKFIDQFLDNPITIDFQRTRNSTDLEGDTRRQRFYKVGEIDIVGACLFARTMEWKFLFASASNFDRHPMYEDRYSNKLVFRPKIWKSSLEELLAEMIQL